LSACQVCSGTGFEIVEKDGREVARRCACRARAVAATHDFAGECRIPPRYQECSLGSFDAAHAPLRAAYEVCLQYCNGYPHLGTTEEGLGLLFVGTSGVGKTHLAVSVLRELYERKRVRGQFWDFRDLMREIKRSFDPETRTTEFRVLDPVVQADVLLLDDLGSARFTEWMSDTLFYVLNTRYIEKRPTLVTTNYLDMDPETIVKDQRAAQTGEGRFEELKHIPYLRTDQYLVERVGVPLRSRLMQMCHVITIKAPDHRAARQASTLDAIRRSAR
jgi:DNA replication protein DnaC